MGSEAARPRSSNLEFAGWGSGIFVVASVAMLLVCRHLTGGKVVYVVDDAAIHLSVAQTLLHHGTWGVQPGVYESVSSSPLWDLLLAGAMAVTRTMVILPWAFNVLAGVWLIWAVGSRQEALRPSLRKPLSVVATAGLVTVLLLMPSLAMVGMEHLLHAAMVVQLMAWVHDRAVGRRTRAPGWALYALAALAVLTRFETMWVVAGVGLGYLVDGWARLAPQVGMRRAVTGRLGTVVGLGLATAAPVAAYAGLNRAMGQGFLPNSVVAKTALSSGSQFAITPGVFLEHLTAAPILAALLMGAIAYLAIAVPTGINRCIVPAVAVIVAVVAHSTFAQLGHFERYQAYLIAMGLYFALSAFSEVLPSRSSAVAVLAIASLLLVPVKWAVVKYTPRGAVNDYAQRYQGALLARRYYDGRSIATGELGYIALFHRGSVTDVLGLGNYEVLQRRAAGTDDQAFYGDLTRRNGVEMAAVYSGALGPRTPSGWFLVAEWRLDFPAVSSPNEPYQLWATSASEAVELRSHLMEFGSGLPAHVNQFVNGCLDSELAAAGAGGSPPAGLNVSGRGGCLVPTPG